METKVVIRRGLETYQVIREVFAIDIMAEFLTAAINVEFANDKAKSGVVYVYGDNHINKEIEFQKNSEGVYEIIGTIKETAPCCRSEYEVVYDESDKKTYYKTRLIKRVETNNIWR